MSGLEWLWDKYVCVVWLELLCIYLQYVHAIGLKLAASLEADILICTQNTCFIMT